MVRQEVYKNGFRISVISPIHKKRFSTLKEQGHGATPSTCRQRKSIQPLSNTRKNHLFPKPDFLFRLCGEYLQEYDKNINSDLKHLDNKHPRMRDTTSFLNKCGIPRLKHVSKRFLQIKRVSRNSSCKVFSAFQKNSGRQVHLKLISLRSLNDRTHLFSVLVTGNLIQTKQKNQIRILQSLDSFYAPKLIQAFHSQKDLFIVTEKPGKQSLRSFLQKHFHKIDVRVTFTRNSLIAKISFKEKIFTKVAKATSFMHSRHIVHGNLTLDTVMIDKQCKIKVTDFSSASFSDWKLFGKKRSQLPSIYPWRKKALAGKSNQTSNRTCLPSESFFVNYFFAGVHSEKA